MTPKELQQHYNEGKNITELLRNEFQSDVNTEEIIEMAYDLQTGSYVDAIKNPSYFQHKVDYGKAIAETIARYTDCVSVLEPGVGEGTTLSFVMNAMANKSITSHGFDISWSRVDQCKKWLTSQNVGNNFLCLGSIFNAPYLDDSFDVVYTSHTIEPNGGNESEIVKELYRVASKYLILVEPAYELADEKSKRRMEDLGYCRNLVAVAESLGMKVITHELFPHSANPLNPTGLIVIEKNPDAEPTMPKLACPRYLESLEDEGEFLYSKNSLHSYPKINGIPCLRPKDGIFSSKYKV